MTQASKREMDDHISRAMQSWADQGSLTPERSYELERLVYQMSHQTQRGRLFSFLRGAVAALAAYITMLFFACPAAGSMIPAVEVLVDNGGHPQSVLEGPAIDHLTISQSYIISRSHLKGVQA